jgi:hypothetical protein
MRVTYTRESFFRRTSPEPNTGCWLWLGGGSRRYGQISVSDPSAGARRRPTAHRVSWELHRGPVPDGLYVCHKCDVTFCVNPAHLFVGTQTDNMRDCANKGRIRGGNAPGEQHWGARLTAAEVSAIRRLVADGVLMRVVAERYGVSVSHVGDIVSGRRWAHVL